MTRSFIMAVAIGFLLCAAANAQVAPREIPVMSGAIRAGKISVAEAGLVRLRLEYSEGEPWSLALTDPAGTVSTVSAANVAEFRIYGNTIELPVSSGGDATLETSGAVTAVVWESFIGGLPTRPLYRQGGLLENMNAAFRASPANAQVTAWSTAVVRVRWSSPDDATRWCSGLQYDSGLILTNRHCLPPDYDKSAPRGLVEVQFGPFASGLSDVVDTVPATVAMAERTSSSSDVYAVDMAVLRLGRPPKDATYAAGRVAIVDGAVSQTKAMVLSIWSYPDQANGKVVSRGPKCVADISVKATRNCGTQMIFHQCETEEGSSGAPMLDQASGKLIGLHYHGLVAGGGNCALGAGEIRSQLKMAGLGG